MSEVVRERYEKHHQERSRYGSTFGGAGRLDSFRRSLAGVSRLLDLGCRDGTLVERLALKDCQAIGFDIDGVALRRAARVPGLQVAQANLWSGLPARSGSFDAVLAGEFLEHCPDPWLVAKEVFRVLTADGVFVGSVPNATRLRNRLRFLIGHPVEVDRTHLHSFSPSTLRECLAEAGFSTEISFRESHFLVFLPSLTANTMVFRATKTLAGQRSPSGDR